MTGINLAKMSLVIVMALVLLGCGDPSPMATTSPLGSPLGAQSPLPSPTSASESDEDVVAFELARPVVPGSTAVTGQGPAGVPILIVDVTMGGNVLGMGTVRNNGTFRVEVSSPLEARHRIGLALGNLEGTTWDADDFRDEGYYGSGALSVPQVGFFYDTVSIIEP